MLRRIEVLMRVRSTARQSIQRLAQGAGTWWVPVLFGALFLAPGGCQPGSSHGPAVGPQGSSAVARSPADCRESPYALFDEYVALLSASEKDALSKNLAEAGFEETVISLEHPRMSRTLQDEFCDSNLPKPQQTRIDQWKSGAVQARETTWCLRRAGRESKRMEQDGAFAMLDDYVALLGPKARATFFQDVSTQGLKRTATQVHTPEWMLAPMSLRGSGMYLAPLGDAPFRQNMTRRELDRLHDRVAELLQEISKIAAADMGGPAGAHVSPVQVVSHPGR